MAGNNRPTKAQRREEARRKAAELRAKQEREQRRNKIVGMVLLGVAVLVIAGGIFALVKRQLDINANKAKFASASWPRPTEMPDPADVTAPEAADQDLVGIPVSQQGVGVAVDGVQVDVYLDFMCPGCGQLERTHSEAIATMLAQDDDVTVVYHVVSIMDRASQGTNYSSRAANAVSVVADQDPEHFPSFVSALFENQPEEGSKGLTDEKIAKLARDVGVPTAVTDQFTTTTDFEGDALRTFVPWTAAVTATLPVNPATGSSTTPAIYVGGERWDTWSTESLADRVASARTATAGDATDGEG